ncbi:MAG TPA: arginine deiminase-related protein [Xanthobacteraceae bacterium]|nr:arginine deiminase-related protein [Xanthobacteraceae bacterium]
MNIHATRAQAKPQPRFLMCPPRFFAVSYSINPWMDPNAWAGSAASLHAQAEQQWTSLRRVLQGFSAQVSTLDPMPGLPDLVFTANAAVVLDRKAVLARFRHGERRDEEPVFDAAFQTLRVRGIIDEIIELPQDVRLEGAGDCIYDARRGLFWLGCGFRSDAAAAGAIEEALGLRCVTLPLADARFYHLDTALCVLPCGGVVYYPQAFTPPALAAIHEHVAPGDRIELSQSDAARFAANAVCVGHAIVLSSCGNGLRAKLERRGYAVVETPLDVFQRSGGSTCCLTLRLDHRSRAAASATAATMEAAMPVKAAVGGR